MLLNNQQITEEIKKEIKICIETSENENISSFGNVREGFASQSEKIIYLNFWGQKISKKCSVGFCSY